ncbi:hypothetical protein ACFC6U_41670, partial [Kitasatospora purpeofusca]
MTPRSRPVGLRPLGAVVLAAALACPILTPTAHAAVAAVPDGCVVVPLLGNNTITCANGIPAGQTLDAGPGNDTVIVTGTVLGTINGQGGDDSITITGPAGALDYNLGANKGGPGVGVGGNVDGGAGNDHVRVTGGLGGRGLDPVDDHLVIAGDGGPGTLGTP